jgi:hypothetical protein
VSTKNLKQPLSVTHPELAKELHTSDASTVSAGSKTKLSWKCPKSHIYDSSPEKRTSRHQGCPYCANQKVWPGFNDLQSHFPAIASEADGWNPLEVVLSSAKKKSWRCELGHKWEAQVRQRTQQELGCPYCSNQRVLKGFNDLGSRFPEMAKQADGWNPSEYTFGSHSILDWKCELRGSHKWRTSPKSRTRSSSGCPYCANRRVEVGFNDLATTHPDLAAEAHGWDPATCTFGSRGLKTWECNQGHVYEALISNRLQSLNNKKQISMGCPFCANHKVLVGFNDLMTTHPEIALQADGWDPSTITYGASSVKKWKCEDGHYWFISPGGRTGKGGADCPTCSASGFDPNLRGYLYFLKHESWAMYQIGITSYPEKRMAQHKKLGWEVAEIRGPMDGHLTQQWETAILRMLRAKGADLSNSLIAGKFDGFSESWRKSTFDAKSIKELMRQTEEFEESTSKKLSKKKNK